MNIRFSANGHTFKGLTDNQSTGITVTDVPTAGAAVDGANVSLYDLDYKVRVISGTLSDKRIAAVAGDIHNPIVFTSENPAIATVDASGNVTYVANGSTVIVIKNLATKEEKRVAVTMTDAGAVNLVCTQGYKVGSLGEHVFNGMQAVISGKTKTDAYLSYFTGYTSTTVTINPTNILSAFYDNFTSVLRDGQITYPMTLVTNQHALCAKHCAPSVGSTIIFKTPTDTYVTATVAAVTAVTMPDGSGGTLAPDICVVYFSGVVAGITPARTLPSDWATSHLRSLFQRADAIDGTHPAIVGCVPLFKRAMHNLTGTWQSYMQVVPMTSPVDGYFVMPGYLHCDYGIMPSDMFDPFYAPFDGWGINSIPGDSGGPNYMLINGELIIVGHTHTTAGTSDIATFGAAINTIMDTQAGAAAGTYTLSVVDLSAFNAY